MWAPDGHSLAYSRVETEGQVSVMQVSASGGEPKQLLPPGDYAATDWSADGNYLLLRKGSLLVGPGDIYEVPLSDLAHPRALLETPFAEYHARFSHDGRWVSYVSNESGRDEVYVMRFQSARGRTGLAEGGRLAVPDLDQRAASSHAGARTAPSSITCRRTSR